VGLEKEASHESNVVAAAADRCDFQLLVERNRHKIGYSLPECFETLRPSNSLINNEKKIKEYNKE
jgi:hypothetical protein